MDTIKEELIKLLRKTADDFEVDNTNINEEQMLKITELLTHRELSKEEAAIHLKMSTSRFNTLVNEGRMPKGRKKLGFKEKVWYKNEIDDCYNKLKKKQ